MFERRNLIILNYEICIYIAKIFLQSNNEYIFIIQNYLSNDKMYGSKTIINGTIHKNYSS